MAIVLLQNDCGSSAGEKEIDRQRESEREKHISLRSVLNLAIILSSFICINQIRVELENLLPTLCGKFVELPDKLLMNYV